MNNTKTQEYRTDRFFTFVEIQLALLPGLVRGDRESCIRLPLCFSIKSNGHKIPIAFRCNGCHWEQNPHGGDQAEEMLILAGQDHNGSKCEIQISFREQSARLVYISPT